jgi:hypothetical protein
MTTDTTPVTSLSPLPTDTTPVKQEDQETLNVITATVDDVELLNILGITSAPSSPQQPAVVLDWDDMPELSEEEEDDDEQSTTTQKRKYNEDEYDLFAEFDFVEVQPKKQRKFVNEEDEDLLNTMNVLPLDEDIRLALDLLSSSS